MMAKKINNQRLTNLLNGMQKSIDLFPSQGYADVYFKAQFLRGSRKQNCIDRGDISSFAGQIRTYVRSEDADTVRIEFIDEQTGKSIYSKVLTDLSPDGMSGAQQAEKPAEAPGLGGYYGLGEAQVNALIDKRVGEARMQDDYQRATRELDELRSLNAALEEEKEELEATLKAKKDTEYYMGIIGTVFPGLATILQGTRLANAASFLAGTTDMSGNALPAAQPEEGSESAELTAMLGEFCKGLTTQELASVHLLFIAFEKDRAQIARALHFITTQTPSQA